MTKAANKQATVLSDKELTKLRAIVAAEKGVAGAARRLNVPRGTLAAALGNAGLREGTALLMRTRLSTVLVGS